LNPKTLEYETGVFPPASVLELCSLYTSKLKFCRNKSSLGTNSKHRFSSFLYN